MNTYYSIPRYSEGVGIYRDGRHKSVINILLRKLVVLKENLNLAIHLNKNC
jgi:hypothetical protein